MGNPLPSKRIGDICDFFSQRMETNRGDLTDIVRSTVGLSDPSIGDAIDPIITDWQLLPPPPEHVHFPLMTQQDFGDPFASFGDPLLPELPGTEFFDDLPDTSATSGDYIGDALLDQKIVSDQEMKRPCNVFFPTRDIEPLPIVTAGDMMKVSSSSSSSSSFVAGCPVEHGLGVQKSSPIRTPHGIKRRKSQAKKVVCIPAPAAVTSRSTGEVVPSDLWAWRKYGQKPIKGSPYPRGYYRCSSSKGCSARKQVERSRTDPNMLVITYTSDHNHPWPTQRNALAGSTRSRTTAKNSSSSTPKISPHKQQTPVQTTLKVEEPPGGITVSSISTTMLVKEEAEEMEIKGVDMNVMDHREFDRIFHHHSYRPMIPDSSHPDDFFADLAELETDSMDVIFSKGFNGEKSDGREVRETKISDSFNMFEWTENSFGESNKKRL